ncbi:hypothetical protein [Ciceribacter lividus]|uniref:hypothetical protein n=1 Tax=Ciceribacter lividus TaxID=1197950 RepID=UPI0014733D2A|nr:hypothetical protein [Ciceribacter lividus]
MEHDNSPVLPPVLIWRFPGAAARRGEKACGEWPRRLSSQAELITLTFTSEFQTEADHE